MAQFEFRPFHSTCWMDSTGTAKKLTISKLHGENTHFFFLEDKNGIQYFADADQPLIYKQENDRFETIKLPFKDKIKRQFSLQNGNKLLQSNNKVYLVDARYKKLAEHSHFNFFWHGSQSIDESASGAILFSEYTDNKIEELQPLRVWRSEDGGKSWKSALTLKSSPKNKAAEIRHYHTCFCDPDIAGRWYVSTGDLLDNNRLYISDDEGLSWERIPVNTITPSKLIPNKFKHNILRFTSCFFRDGYLYWGTDDFVGIKQPAYVRIDRQKIREGKYEILGMFDHNLIRSLIPDEDGGCLTVAESKYDVSKADLHYVDANAHVCVLDGLPNFSGLASGSTLSINSLQFNHGRAYSLHDIHLFKGKRPGALRYDMQKLDSNDQTTKLLQRYSTIKTSLNPLLVFFHAQRTAGTTLKNVLKGEFGAQNVYYHRVVKDFKLWKDLTPQDLEPYKAYGAHDNFELKNPTEIASHFYMSVIRNPIERAKSLYHYLKTRPEHKLHPIAMQEDMLPFYKKAMEIAPKYVSNVQTLRVCGQQDFEAAKEVIEKHFALLGPFDRIDEIIHCLEEFFEFKGKGKFEKKETKATSHQELDSETLAYIEAINAEDIKLYHYVNEFFDRAKPLLLSVARQNF